MKITGFGSLIVSPKADDLIQLFEELEFEKKHQPTEIVDNNEVTNTCMKDSNSFHIDITAGKQNLQDVMEIRMNVDDFEEAYNILIKHGFKNTRGDNTLDTRSAKAATMVSPSGFIIALVKHIKEDK